MQWRFLQLELQQSESELLTTLQVQMYSIELRKGMIYNAAYILQHTVMEIENTVMPKNKALLVLFV